MPAVASPMTEDIATAGVVREAEEVFYLGNTLTIGGTASDYLVDKVIFWVFTVGSVSDLMHTPQTLVDVRQ